VEVSVSGGPDGVRVAVRDDGLGLPGRPGGDGWLHELADGGHYGLLGMHERARRGGGELTVESVPGGGTSITVRFPGGAAGGGVARNGTAGRTPAGSGMVPMEGSGE
jgi:signal transduction histidine kinase